MGYRSTFTTDHLGGTLPAWFVEKWEHLVHFGHDGRSFPLSAKAEAKFYSPHPNGFEGFPDDLARAWGEMCEKRGWDDFRLCLLVLHEDGQAGRYTFRGGKRGEYEAAYFEPVGIMPAG